MPSFYSACFFFKSARLSGVGTPFGSLQRPYFVHRQDWSAVFMQTGHGPDSDMHDDPSTQELVPEAEPRVPPQPPRWSCNECGVRLVPGDGGHTCVSCRQLPTIEACIECNAPRNGETFVRGQCAACVQAENRWFADGGQRIGPSTTRRSHEGEDEQDAGEDDEEDEDGEEEQEPIGSGAPPQEAATTAEGQSAGTITLCLMARSMRPRASRPLHRGRRARQGPSTRSSRPSSMMTKGRSVRCFPGEGRRGARGGFACGDGVSVCGGI